MAVIEATDADFREKIQENQHVIVKYYAGWCGACRLFSPKYKRMSGEEGFSNVAFLDVDAEHNPEARKLAGVKNLPFFAVFKNGELVKGDSTAKEEAVRSMIENDLLA